MIGRAKKIAKSLLAISWIRKAYVTSTRILLEFFAANRLTSLIYSILSVPIYNREQFAVLRGQRDYYRNLRKNRFSRTELRRNIHRLEKGILMRPRRRVFALDYIDETIEFYEVAIASYSRGTTVDEGELAWAHEVLASYFSIVDGADPVVARALQRFEKTKAVFDPAEAPRTPFPRSASVKSDVTYDGLLALAMQRRSVRWFQPKPVPRDLVDKALLVARQSPTACNRLPYEIRLFDDPQLVRQVASVPFGSAGYSHQIPTVAVVIGRQSNFFSPRDRHVIYIDASLAAMAFMLGLETLGLASSVINWPDFEPLEIKMQKLLGLNVDERVVMLIAIGYADPDGLVAHSEKKPLEALRSYNQLRQKATSIEDGQGARGRAASRPETECAI